MTWYRFLSFLVGLLLVLSILMMVLASQATTPGEESGYLLASITYSVMGIVAFFCSRLIYRKELQKDSV